MPQSKDEEPPAKRRRASKSVIGPQHRESDLGVCMDVDLLTLDYVAYQATLALLSEARPGQDRGGSTVSVNQNLGMSNSFLAIFQAKYPTYQADDELDFRILLLKFTTLFAQRLTCNESSPSLAHLKELRKQNRTRAKAWIRTPSHKPTHNHDTSAFETDLPLPLEDLERSRADILNSLGLPPEDGVYDGAFYGTTESLMLLDILPLYMQVSAVRNRISGSNPTQQWMELAGVFMLQACLEQYRVQGASGSEAVDEAFAWGSCGHNLPGSTTNGEEEIDIMFMSGLEPDEEIPGWAQIKQRYLERLIPPSQDGTNAALPAHLEATAAEHPITEFNEKVLDFLAALLESMPHPILVQLEKGTLDGFTPGQTVEFLETCGLPAGWPSIPT